MCQLTTPLLLTSFLFSLVGADFSSVDEYLEVQISSGSIRGIKMTSSWTNQTFYAFLGVPYAAPPVGDLRFKDPTYPMKWTGVKNCTSEQSSCFQPSVMFKTDEKETLHNGMSEDCLYINVYSPELEPTGGLLPVMVWMHGGGFVTGSGNYSSAGPDWLLAEGVVVVTCNYRLGAFGFPSLGTSDAPGNSGLKDQRMALLWVQKEINHFGGDPARVTLFGESAGAASVHLHYLSPLSVGLFQGVIADSGTGLESWAAKENNTNRGLQLAKDLNCDVTTLSSALSCLKAADATAVLTAQLKGGSSGLFLQFVPTVDRFSVKPFLPEMPEILLKQGQGSFVPFFMGTNRDEGALGLAVGEETINKIKDNLSLLIPDLFKSSSSGQHMAHLEERVSNFYFGNSSPSYSNIRGFLNLYSDAFFSYSTARCAKHFRKRGSVYLYYFTFDGKFKEPYVLHYGHLLNTSLVSHAEELNYLFVVKSVNQTAEDDSAETITRKRMVRMWTNFVKFGAPADGSDALLQMVTWLPLDEFSTRHLHVDYNLTMNHSDYLAQRIMFWDTLVPSTAQHLQLHYFIIITSLVTLLKVK